MSFLCLNPKTRIFLEYPPTAHESPVTDQHESSVRPKWNEFPICTSAMCRSSTFNIKRSAKSKKIELNEEFIAMCREEQILWDVMTPLR